MIYQIYAFENNRARLCVAKSSASDLETAHIISKHYISKGWDVKIEKEE